MTIKLDFKKISSSCSIFINELEKLKFDNKIAIITNPKVSGLHLKYLLEKIATKEIFIITVPDGERYKNIDTLSFILDRLFDHKLDRDSLLISFGGGVVGDLSGFAASIFKRGIDFIQIPTTLLSQVDASVGGKTGINNDFGKNMLGTFYQPIAVYCEAVFLDTLSKRQFNSGVSEIIKMATCFDKGFFAWLEESDIRKKSHSLEFAIQKSIEIKAGVVLEDEKETTKRWFLNYGHTFAHAIEKLTNYSFYLHGEAVSIGINMANHLAYFMGILKKSYVERIENLLKRYLLPVYFNVEDNSVFYNSLILDKKNVDSNLSFILLKEIGFVIKSGSISKDNIMEFLNFWKKLKH